MPIYTCERCGETLRVGLELAADERNCFGCRTPLAEVSAAEDLDRHRHGAKLAGFVLAVLGVITYGTTSPFGLMLSAEKMGWRNRSPGLRTADWVGVVLGGLGTLFLPVFLVGMWNYSLVGPQPVLLYLAFLAGWTWHRVRVVWRWPRPTAGRPPAA
jgi:hypothetical protein